MERAIVGQLHQRQEPRNAINAQFDLPGPLGDIFLLPLFSNGRGKNEMVEPFSTGRASQWLGRRLRFNGFLRNQKIGMVE